MDCCWQHSLFLDAFLCICTTSAASDRGTAATSWCFDRRNSTLKPQNTTLHHCCPTIAVDSLTQRKLNVSATASTSTYALVRPVLACGDAVCHHASCQCYHVKLGRSCISIVVSYSSLRFLPRSFFLEDCHDALSALAQRMQANSDSAMAAVEYRSRNSARISYVPPPQPQPAPIPPTSTSSHRSSRSLDFFNPRRTPPGRIRVQNLGAFIPEPPKPTDASAKREPRFKLAVSR